MTDYKDLIAEAYEYGDAIFGGEGENWMRLVTLVCKLADALESLTPTTVTTVEELDALPGNSILYSDSCWAVLRKQSHFGSRWITDHGSHNGESLTPQQVLSWGYDWVLLFRPTPTSPVTPEGTK